MGKKPTLGKGHGSDNLSQRSGSGPVAPLGISVELRPYAPRLAKSIKAPGAHKSNSLPPVSVDDVYLTLGQITLTRDRLWWPRNSDNQIFAILKIPPYLTRMRENAAVIGC